MIELRCAICEAGRSVAREVYRQNFTTEDLTPETFSARRTPEHLHYRMVRCAACSLLYSSPVLEQEKLQALYTRSTMTYGEEIPCITATYSRCLRKYYRGCGGSGCAVEIGCGNGFMLPELTKMGFRRVLGFEPSLSAWQSAPEEIRTSIRNSSFSGDSLEKDSIDLVCSFQTLDHMLCPLTVLKDCRRILKPGGLAIFITHDERAIQARLFGEKSPIIDVEHIYLFNKRTLRLLFEKAGFKVAAVFRVRNTYSLQYWLRMSPLPFRQNLIRFLRKCGFHRIPIPLYAGNIGIVACK